MSKRDLLDDPPASPEEERIRETLTSIRRDYGREAAPSERPSRPRFRIRQRASAHRQPQSRPLIADSHPRRRTPPAGPRTLRRTLLVLATAAAVVFAVALALAPHRGGDRAAEEQAEHRAMNLLPGDLPGYAAHAKQHSAAGRQIGARLQRCLGVAGGQRDGSNVVSSPTFTKGSSLLTRQVVSHLGDISGTGGASDFALVRSGRVTTCLKRQLNGVIIPTPSGPPVSISGIRVNQMRTAAPGAKASFGLHVAMSLGARERAVPVHLNLFGYAVGDDEVSLVTLALSHPFPAGLEQHLSSLLVRRVRHVDTVQEHRQATRNRGAASA